jgi:hypothetical protein
VRRATECAITPYSPTAAKSSASNPKKPASVATSFSCRMLLSTFCSMVRARRMGIALSMAFA